MKILSVLIPALIVATTDNQTGENNQEFPLIDELDRYHENELIDLDSIDPNKRYALHTLGKLILELNRLLLDERKFEVQPITE